MADLDEQIQRIEDKVASLLKEYNNAQKEVERLKKENLRLQELLKANTDLADKTKRDSSVKLSPEHLKATSRKELEKKIETYLKDIDKCLALLHS